MRAYDTLTKRRYLCEDCEPELIEIRWGLDSPPVCSCGKSMYEVSLYDRNPATAVIGDECDVYIRHGICNEDGTPKRYRSKSDIRKAAYEAGYTQGGDTPHPNPILVEQRKQAYEKRQRESEVASELHHSDAYFRSSGSSRNERDRSR